MDQRGRSVAGKNKLVLGINKVNGTFGLWDFGSSDDAIGFISHWMPLPEPPKPKEPTFKDVFLKAFPKAPVNKNGIPTFCIGCVFPQVHNIKEMNCDWEHETCWNKPYFEEEGEEGE